jgi:hypothetical protein
MYRVSAALLNAHVYMCICIAHVQDKKQGAYVIYGSAPIRAIPGLPPFYAGRKIRIGCLVMYLCVCVRACVRACVLGHILLSVSVR